MSIIIHRCACGHPEMWHPNQGACPAPCPCGRFRGQAPEVLPTFDSLGKPVDTVQEPGTTWGGGGRTCGCDACRAFFASLSGDAA